MVGKKGEGRGQDDERKGERRRVLARTEGEETPLARARAGWEIERVKSAFTIGL